MKYMIDNAHREFFSLYRWIEFEDLISQTDLVDINDAIDLVIAARMAAAEEPMGGHRAQDAYVAGRDVWRDSKRIQQLVCQRRLAEMVADLVDARPLRLAFDQAVVTEPQGAAWQPPGVTIEALSAFRGLAAGLILCLKDGEGAPPPFFPAKAGNGICVAPSMELNLSQLYRGGAQRYLIIGYGKAVTLFVHQPDDTYATTMRGMGYNYGDRLVDRLHPVVIR